MMSKRPATRSYLNGEPRQVPGLAHGFWRSYSRRGMTLVEILIAMVMTLIVLGAMMVAFRYASAEIAKGRAMIELSNQLRMAQETIRADLEGVTVDMRPWAISAGPAGYFTYIEGAQSDKTSSNPDTIVNPTYPANRILGDYDDILAMTVRGNGREFKGRGRVGPGFEGENITSQLAEVVWWTNFVDRNANSELDYDESIQVYRRQLLIRPEAPPQLVNSWEDVESFFQLYDISMRVVVDGSGTPTTLIANSLEDLAKRENRFAHWFEYGLTPPPFFPSFYPYRLSRAALQRCQRTETNMARLSMAADARRFLGGDIMISDVLAFDIKVFSPQVPIQLADNVPLTPADVGYGTGVNADQGAFIDIGFSGLAFDPTLPEFSTLPAQKTVPLFVYTEAGLQNIVLDTFSKHYESNGIDDDRVLGIDQGTNGIDDDAANGVDDNGERETLPPYPFRIQGVQVSFRVVERNTQQVRQTSVVHSFMPR